MKKILLALALMLSVCVASTNVQADDTLKDAGEKAGEIFQQGKDTAKDVMEKGKEFYDENKDDWKAKWDELVGKAQKATEEFLEGFEEGRKKDQAPEEPDTSQDQAI